MKPTIKTERYELWLGDCAEILPHLPAADLLLIDPPYGIDESSSSVKSRQRKDGGNSKALANQRDYGSFSWDKKPLSADLMLAIRAKTTHQIIWGGNYYELPPTSCWLVWDKMNGENDFADCELAWTNFPKAVRIIRHRWNGMLRQGQEPRFHPTQKPLGVIAWAIQQAPITVKTLLDPTAGSGTSIVAGVQAGIYSIGIECDPRYFEMMAQRLEAATGQFSPREFGGLFADA